MTQHFSDDRYDFKRTGAFVIIIILFCIQDGELFGIDQTFWETPFTKKWQPAEPKGHYLHAKKPILRPATLKSSMVSGHLGNLRRHQIVSARAEQIRRSTLGATTYSPAEYVALLRRKYEELRNRAATKESQEGEDELVTTSKDEEKK